MHFAPTVACFSLTLSISVDFGFKLYSGAGFTRVSHLLSQQEGPYHRERHKLAGRPVSRREVTRFRHELAAGFMAMFGEGEWCVASLGPAGSYCEWRSEQDNQNAQYRSFWKGAKSVTLPSELLLQPVWTTMPTELCTVLLLLLPQSTLLPVILPNPVSHHHLSCHGGLSSTITSLLRH